MPKLVNYASRFAFLREAAFVVVRDRDVAALRRHSVAEALGTSMHTVRRLLDPGAALVALAADEVERRRRHGRLGRLRDAPPLDAATHVLRGLLPDSGERVAEEFVWLRLLLSGHRLPVDHEQSVEGLRQRFSVAEGQFQETGPDEAVPTEAPRDPIRDHRERREEEIETRVGAALDLLGVPDHRRVAAAVDVRAVVDGLTLAVCTDRLVPDEGIDALRRQLALVAAGSDPVRVKR